jgi:hypothetical protein
MKNLNDGYVYFIQCGTEGPIKIGYSKYENAENRLTVAQVYNPILLTLLCVIHGGRSKEIELHNQFKNDCIIGEWFTPTQELYDYILQFDYLGLTTKDFQRSGPTHQEHHFWKGSLATNESKRSRVVRRYPIKKKDKCQKCHVKNAHDRYHKDGNLDNIEPENILFVCRRCCMELDGRLSVLKNMDRSHLIKPKQPCIICRKLYKPLRKGRCHACTEYYRRNNKERSKILNESK